MDIFADNFYLCLDWLYPPLGRRVVALSSLVKGGRFQPNVSSLAEGGHIGGLGVNRPYAPSCREWVLFP